MTGSSVGRLPAIEMGRGRIGRLPDLVARHGRRALIITGAGSFRRTSRWPDLLAALAALGIRVDDVVAAGEPSPALVDGAVAAHLDAGIDVVVGIGGGSVLDAAKAIAGLLPSGRSVMDHLEVVGRGLPYAGPALPFIAVPTTAGTGSEATKNAVLSVRGPGGFKRSFRDDRLVAAVAIVDPDLLDTCPRALIACDGMDAVTQLLEAYVSAGAGPLTDALALSGLAAARDALLPWFDRGPDAGEATAVARERMAWAALASGICLANAGLGAVHALAAPLGAALPIPHGAACGILLAPATAANVYALDARDPDGRGLARYATAGRVLLDDAALPDAEARAGLVALLAAWAGHLGVAGLASFGLDDGTVDAIVADASPSTMRTNPVALDDGELAAILRAAL